MLKKQYRLPAYVKLSRASSFATPLFFLKVTENNLDHSRFSFVVSKKTDKRATARNRIRRLFRSCIEEMLDEIKTGRDMLFLLKITILEINREDLYNQLHVFLKEKNLLK
jgi:ribonuclease P protein component